MLKKPRIEVSYDEELMEVERITEGDWTAVICGRQLWVVGSDKRIQAASHSTCCLLPYFPTVLLFYSFDICQLLVRTNLSPWPHLPVSSSFPCQRPHCKTCPTCIDSLFFTSLVTNLTYLIPSLMSPAISVSIHLVDLFTCTQCDAFYMGETRNSLSTRMSHLELSYQFTIPWH